MTASSDILELVQRWAAAEQHNDAKRLGELLTDDFTGVGPVGFVISRKQWLDRFDKGLENRAFTVEEPQVRSYGDAAVVVGVQAQETSVRGSDSSGRFRVSLVAVRPADRWLLANVHIGPLQYPAATRTST
ncbi:nuclear transport factor 2 family protein [Streptomyces sp. NPDC048484]|uniref:nuclear transport factor 2 family protein n=1 Tax=Streptomyces sp. NPDC048484 TaxID=3155146 RepID=UPI00341CA0C8